MMWNKYNVFATSLNHKISASYSTLSQWQVSLMLSRDVSLLVAGPEKKIQVGCRELCLYLMWNDTYMTAKSEHNCSLNNETKCSQCLHQLSFIPTFRCLLCFLSLQNCKVVSLQKHQQTWKWNRVCHLIYSLDEIQFQFGLNAFACSLWMFGQCISGQKNM